MRSFVPLFLLVACGPVGGGTVPATTTGTPAGLPTGTAAGTLSSPTGTATTAVFPTELVDIGNYERLMEERLFTHLGDNRGFGPEHDLARDHIVEELESYGLTVTLDPFDYRGTTYHNVVAVQPGSDPSAPAIAVGAHFDSVDNPGADDNATGTAMVLEVARVLSQYELETTVHWVLFDREEQGLVGSRAWAGAHRNELWFALTADMIGQDHGTRSVDLFATEASRGLVETFAADGVDRYGAGQGANVRLGPNFGFSDHQAFEELGVPAFVIIEADYAGNPNYHQSTDASDLTATYVDYAYVADTLRSVVGFLADQAVLVD